jgi:hypothetical protein
VNSNSSQSFVVSPLFNFKNIIIRSVWLTICGCVFFTGCAKSVKDETATQPVSDEITSTPDGEPQVQTAQEPSTTELPWWAMGTGRASDGNSAEIVSIPEVKPSAEVKGDSAEKVAPAPSAAVDQPQVETARAPSAPKAPSWVKRGRTTEGRSAKIVSMRPSKRSVDGKDFEQMNATLGDRTMAAVAPKTPSAFLLLMRRLAMLLIEMDPRAHLVPSNQRLPFSPDPVYTAPYDPEAQLAIYGAKHPNPTARPLIEAGRELYGPGEFQPGINLLGEKNLVFPQLLMYGDGRTAIAYNDNGAIEKGLVATRLNLDIDFKITATERIHLFITPLNRAALFTRVEFAGDKQHSGVEIDFEPIALFFEGDLGRLFAGFSNQENHVDLPFTFGLIPLLFQNGVWMQDAFAGFAITIPARNSPALGITNADITFFAGFDQVTTGAIPNDHSADIFGVATFVEAASGYFEFDYGYTLGRKDFDDLSYHNLSAAFTRRYFDTVSNSVRIIYNFGQDPDHNHRRTADGVLLLVENSLITPLPLTLVPYFNLFAGFNKPQSIARAGAAGGVLLNTGILFETDNLTGFPTMDAIAHNTYGGSLGIEYLFDLHQQIVFEVSALNVFGDAKDRTAKGGQVGFGVRYQLPLNNAWILRADAMVASREDDQDLFGIRTELRRKF